MTKGQLKLRTRAVAPQDKAARRAALLRAAEEMLRRDPVAAMTVDGLARKAGLGKGTVYLYFRTREEVLLQVHLARLQGLFDALDAAVADLQSDAAYAAVRAALRYLRQHPEFLSLASNCRGMLQANAGGTTTREFKRALDERLSAIGARVEARYPGMPSGDGAALLTGAYALMVGLWQVAGPLDEARGPVPRIDYEKQLATALLALWAGSVGAIRPASGAAPILAGTP